MTATTFGDTETACAAAARVKAAHRRVRGIDPSRAGAYAADDPDTQLWVHCVEWHSFLAVYRAYGGRLSPQEQDAYLAEGARVAALLDVPPERVPASVDADARVLRVGAPAAVHLGARPRGDRLRHPSAADP